METGESISAQHQAKRTVEWIASRVLNAKALWLGGTWRVMVALSSQSQLLCAR